MEWDELVAIAARAVMDDVRGEGEEAALRAESYALLNYAQPDRERPWRDLVSADEAERDVRRAVALARARLGEGAR